MAHTSSVVTSNDGIEMYAYWSVVSQDPSTNTSDVRVTVYFESTAGGDFKSVNVSGTVEIGPVQASFKQSGGLSDGSSYFGISVGTITVPHASDGSGTVQIKVTASGTIYSPGYFTATLTEEITLPAISLASSIAATSANIEEGTVIVVTRRNASLQHSIEYQLGGGGPSGFMMEDGSVVDSEHIMTASQIVFTIPAEMYEQIPNAKSGTVYLTCRTYNGETLCGTQTTSITATASPERCAPEISGDVVDINETTIAVTGDANTLVRYASTALCTITAVAKNAATIQQKWIQGVEVSEDTLTIAEVETGSFTFDAKDSRGYYNGSVVPNPVAVAKTLVPYIPLTCRAACQRSDPASTTVTLTITGNYYNGSFGAADNALAIKCAVDGGEYMTVEATIQDGTYTAVAELTGLAYTQSHKIEVVAEDAIATAAKTIALSKSIPVFDWGENDFNFNVPTYAPEFWSLDEGTGEFVKLGASGGGAKKVLIWENASPKSDFAAQKITLDLSPYDGIEIVFIDSQSMKVSGNNYHTVYSYMSTGIMPVNFPLQYAVGGRLLQVDVLSDEVDFRYRHASVSESYVYFDRGYYFAVLSDGSTDSDEGAGYNKPYRIYGIKGGYSE